MGFVEGDGGFYATVDRSWVKVVFKITQTSAEILLMQAIKAKLESLAPGSVNIYMQEFASKQPNAKPAYAITIQNVVFFYEILIPLFLGLTFRTKKYLDFLDWVIIIKICCFGLHLNEQGLSLVSDIISRMNNSRLTTHKTHKVVEISEDRINSVLSSPPVYVIKDGARYTISGSRVPTRSSVTAIDEGGNQQVFDTIIECARTLEVDRKRLVRYANTGKLLRSKHSNMSYIITM